MKALIKKMIDNVRYWLLIRHACKLFNGKVIE